MGLVEIEMNVYSSRYVNRNGYEQDHIIEHFCIETCSTNIYVRLTTMLYLCVLSLVPLKYGIWFTFINKLSIEKVQQIYF